MLARTDRYKEEIVKLGKQIDFKINVYTNDKIITEDDRFLMTENNLHLVVEQFNLDDIGETITSQDIYNVSVVRKGNLLSTMMKEVDFEIVQDLKVGTIIDCSFGLKVDNDYEYINYGKFIIFSKEHNEDTNTYSYVAYDSMLLSMIEVDDTSIIQGVTVQQAIENICEKVGLNINITSEDIEKYPNLENEINSEAFNNIEMTYRDVLDMICQCLGVSMVSNNNIIYLEIPHGENIESNEVEDKLIEINDSLEYPIVDFQLKGDTEQDGTPTPTNPVNIETVTGRQEISVSGKNLFDKNAIKTGYYINASGVETSSSSWAISNYIPVISSEDYTYQGITSPGSNAVQSAYYNKNKEFVSTFKAQTGSNTITIPANIFYVRFSVNIDSSNQNTLQIEHGSTATEYEEYKGQSYEINLGKNLFDGELELGTYINSNGNKGNANDQYRNVNKIKVQPNTTYTTSINGIAQQYVMFYYDISETFISYGDNRTGTFTTPENCYYINFRCYLADFTNDYANLKVQIEKGTQATTYSPFKQINLFDKDNTNVVNGWFNNNSSIIVSETGFKTIYIECEPNTTYTIQKTLGKRFWVGYTTTIPDIGVSVNGIKGGNDYYKPITLTTGNNAKYLVAFIYNANADTLTLQQILSSIVIWDTSIAQYPIELCKIGDYQDYIYKSGNKWYKYTKIGKVVLDGSESWTFSSNGNGWYTTINGLKWGNNTDISVSPLYCNYFKQVTRENIASSNYGIATSNSQNITIKHQDYTSSSQSTNFKTWLSSNNPKIYYVLNNAIEEEITDTELIEQLNEFNDAELFEGYNYISNNSNNLLPYIYLKYVNNIYIEEFNEEFLKDINVKFGEKYGPINSVVLSRSEDSDTIYRRDEESIKLNGLHEFKIKDNLIMNFNDREDYIDEIFEQLNDLEFYINDFTSTGITYLEPLDFYNVVIADNTYKCLLLNDEIKVQQGLEESIYTEMPEETTTDYKTSGKTDKEVSFIVDKQNGSINAKVSKGEVINEINLDESGVQIQANKINLVGYITTSDLSGTGTSVINGANIMTGTLSANTISGGHLEIIGNYTYGNAFVDIISPDSTGEKPIGTSIWNNGLTCYDYSQIGIPVIRTESDAGYAELKGDVVNAFGFNNVSLEENKKNFIRFNEGLDTINKIDVYKYNYKTEKDSAKKHIGIVIGENYNYSQEITNRNNDSIDLYSLASLCCEAIKEQQKQIETLKKEIDSLKGDVK